MTQSGCISPWPMPRGNSMNTCRPSSKARSGRQVGLSPSIRYRKFKASMSTPVAIGAAASAAAFWRRERDELVLRIDPGDGRHVGLLGRPQLEMIGAPGGVDDGVGDEVRPRRLDQDVDALGWARPAL